MEVCVESLESAINAFRGGASRIELCSSLSEGGLTPTLGLYKSIKKFLRANDPESRMQINCMIRCRGGDFLYSDSEMETMLTEVAGFVELDEDLKCDGLVFGALDAQGNVDEAICAEFMRAIPSQMFKTTFHRAFDVCAEWEHSFRTIERLGFDKLLTSGQKKTAFEGQKSKLDTCSVNESKFRMDFFFGILGRDLIAKLVGLGSSVGVIAGAGVTGQNLEQILRESRCGEFHASCRVERQSRMVFRRTDTPMGASHHDEFTIKYTCPNRVAQMVVIYNRVVCARVNQSC
jgi:copper homeostasis protein